jgi:hypothetical protein
MIAYLSCLILLVSSTKLILTLVIRRGPILQGQYVVQGQYVGC